MGIDAGILRLIKHLISDSGYSCDVLSRLRLLKLFASFFESLRLIMDATQPTSPIIGIMRDTFKRARNAFTHDYAPSTATRQAQLEALASMLIANKDAIAEAISADFGNRSAHETELLEIFPALSAIKDAKHRLGRWMKPKRAWASLYFLPGRIELRPQPLGVVGIIVPWNYPILLAIAPLVGALAAGNRVMLKMSELTPRTAKLLADLISNTFSSDQVSVINGDVAVAEAFSQLPFDHLLFTGSTQVGRHVMRAAAANLTPVTLELGGKSPAIIGPECDVAIAAEKILFGKCLNAGQTCIAPDYVLLPSSQEAAFIAAAKTIVATLYPTLGANPDYTSIVNLHHLERLHDSLADAASKGASIVPLAGTNEHLDDVQKLAPTIVYQVNDTMRVMQEEIFGPILPLVTYDNLDDAIRYVNDHPRPLALYYFGHDGSNIEQVLNETTSGGVTINDTLLHISQESLPFGGVGPSGMGAYHGKYGFDTFSKIKPVFHQSRLNGLSLFKPPYGKRFESLLKFLLR